MIITRCNRCHQRNLGDVVRQVWEKKDLSQVRVNHQNSSRKWSPRGKEGTTLWAFLGCGTGDDLTDGPKATGINFISRLSPSLLSVGVAQIHTQHSKRQINKQKKKNSNLQELLQTAITSEPRSTVQMFHLSLWSL